MAITKQQIFAAADQLDAAGLNPTLSAIRKAVGGGSFTTVSEAMAEWKALKAARTRPAREAAPESIAQRLSELGADIWAAAVELSHSRLASERTALEQERIELEAAKAEAASLADALSVELEEAKALLVAARQAEQAAQARAAQLQSEAAAAAERAAVAEAKATESARRADDLNAELGRMHTQQAQQAALLDSLAAAIKGKPDAETPKGSR